MAVDDFFYENNLFSYLDYEYTSRTIYDVLFFGIDLHTDEARRLEGKVRELKISIEDKSLNIAIIQRSSAIEHTLCIVADEKGASDWNAIREELLTIEKKPWESIKDIDVIDPRAAKLVPGSLYIPQDKTTVPVRKVSVTYALDKEFADGHTELLPLYNEISELMSENAFADLYSTFGFYLRSKIRSPKKQAVKLTQSFHITEAYPLKLPLVRDVVEDSLLDLYELQGFSRLMTQLRDADHSDPDRIFPGVNYTFMQTGLIVGEKGWQRIATEDNCEQILSHMRVTVSTGRSRASLSLASILDLK